MSHPYTTENKHPECDTGPTECLPCALRSFFDAYWNDRTPQNFPRGAVEDLDTTLKDSFVEADGKDVRAILCTNTQQDVHEFLTVLWDKSLAHAPETKQELEDLFMIQQRIAWTCNDCGKNHVLPAGNSREQGLTLPLAAASEGGQDMSLYDLLDDFCEETLEIRCETNACSRRGQPDAQLGVDTTSKDRRQIRMIVQGPKVLCINLRRSHTEFVAGRLRTRKLTDDVEYPEDLDLSEYTVDGETLKYRLYGVAAHSGKSASGGHWIAVVRHTDGKSYQTINDTELSCNRTPSFLELRYPEDFRRKPFDPTLLVYVKIEGK